MKQWTDRTQELLDLVADAEGTLHTITTLISEEDSLLGLVWDGVVSQSMPEGVTLDGIKESLTSLRDELMLLVASIKKQKRDG